METSVTWLKVGLAASAICFSSPAASQNIDALNVTLPNCKAWLDHFDHKGSSDGSRMDGVNQGRCIGIVEGLFAAAGDICAPNGINLVQTVRLVVSYIEGLPEPRLDNFKALALEGMRKAWPCDRGAR